ncbi:holin family protein [Celeribacter litoreus]|uniref:holin family protein n=1 Tax=Celeribacter litoreus TaxID=2876714 RepID=UPI001CC95F32|nr:holin family protein [Celeribacter litoreus]MCA0044572.1 holin family protein [Celeribacter litoreus]
MGVISSMWDAVFGDGRNVVKETAEVFFENKENSSAREAAYRAAAMQQFAAEFAVERKGWFDRFMDALNRVPRPMMAFGTIGLMVTAMVNPIWFAARMQGVALIPEPLWWLFGTIVSFYFGARFQVKSQEFQRSIATTLVRAPMVRDNIAALTELGEEVAEAEEERAEVPGEDAPNPALAAWKGSL